MRPQHAPFDAHVHDAHAEGRETPHRRRLGHRLGRRTALAWLLLPGLTFGGLTLGGVAIGGLTSGGATFAAPDLFDDLYERSHPIDATLKTIHASFVETTTSPLLAKPLVAEGTLHAVRPTDVELTYTKPDRKTITIKDGHLLFLWPDRKLRQERDISQALGRVEKYFVAKSPSELRRHFTIAASEDAARPGSYLIDMTPKRTQIEQGLTRLELWLRKDTLLLDAMRMHFPGNATKLMEFKDVEINKGG